MLSRHFAWTAAVAVIAIAAPAAAQSTFAHPRGWTVSLPAGITTHPQGAVNDDKGVFVVKRGSTSVGICMISVALRDSPVNAAGWKGAVGAYNSNPEAEGRGNAERAGHSYLRHLGSRPYTSKAGWDGYFFWYERTNSNTNSKQTSVNAATMLSDTQRLVAVCNTNAGYLFDDADINAIQSFVTSARVS